MYEHIFEIINFNDKYQTNGISKFEELLDTFGLKLSEEATLHYEWVNYNHTIVLITEYNPFTGQHAFDKNRTSSLGVPGYTELLCEDKMLLNNVVNVVNRMTSTTIVF